MLVNCIAANFWCLFLVTETKLEHVIIINHGLGARRCPTSLLRNVASCSCLELLDRVCAHLHRHDRQLQTVNNMASVKVRDCQISIVLLFITSVSTPIWLTLLLFRAWDRHGICCFAYPTAE